MRFLAIIAALWPGGIAAADHLRATREQPIVEVAHEVDVSIEDGVAHFRVRRSFENTGSIPDEARLAITVPAGAIASGLRVWAHGRWFDAELMENAAAEARYADAPPHSPVATPVLLESFDTGDLLLALFPVAPRRVATVEYTLIAPTDYHDGAYHLGYPQREQGGLPLVEPVVRVAGQRVHAVPGQGSTPPGSVAAGQRGGITSLVIPPPPIAVLTARLGIAKASREHSLVRFEIDAEPELAPLPVRPQVVFVVDPSYSMDLHGADAIAAQLQVVRAYLGHVPDASVELVAVRRRAERVFGKFVAASNFEAELRDAQRRGAFARGNGSAIDAGARLAGEALADRAGPRRIVILTDGLVRSSLTARDVATVLDRLPADVVVHVVVLDESNGMPLDLERDDDALLAPLATDHRGIYARYDALDPHTASELAPSALGLVRPTRIDELAAPGLAIDNPELDEGMGLRLTATMATPPTRTVISGKLWDEPVRLAITASPAFSRTTAALAPDTDDYDRLDHDEQLRIALAGGAVSPLTALVASDPGEHPPVTGQAGPAGPGRRFGRRSAVPSVSIGAVHRPLRVLLDPSACVARARPPAGWHVTLQVESTRDEIVDVRARGPESPLTACLVEAMWAVRLPPSFTDEHEQHLVSLP